MLITSGTIDDGDVAQAEEAFLGLRRLGKPAELRIYEGGGHLPRVWSREHFRDFIERVCDWFDSYLQQIPQE